MPDPHDKHGSTHKPRRHSIGFAHCKTKGIAIVLSAKAIVIVAVVVLIWVLQLEFEIGTTAIVLLHVALAGALIIYALRTGALGKRRE